MCRKIVYNYKLYNIDLKEYVKLDTLKDIKTIAREQLYDAALQYHNQDTEKLFKWVNGNIEKEDSINKYHTMIGDLNDEFEWNFHLEERK